MFKDGLFYAEDYGAHGGPKAHKRVYIDMELEKFANEFSLKYRQLGPGVYFSDKKTYCINYIDRILNSSGKPTDNPGRVSVTTGNMEMSKQVITDYGEGCDYVFFLIIWLYTQYKLQDIIEADITALKYYMSSTHRSIEPVVRALEKMFKSAPCALNSERHQNLLDIVFDSQEKCDEFFKGDDSFEFMKRLLIC